MTKYEAVSLKNYYFFHSGTNRKHNIIYKLTYTIIINNLHNSRERFTITKDNMLSLGNRRSKPHRRQASFCAKTACFARQKKGRWAWDSEYIFRLQKSMTNIRVALLINCLLRFDASFNQRVKLNFLSLSPLFLPPSVCWQSDEWWGPNGRWVKWGISGMKTKREKLGESEERTDEGKRKLDSWNGITK